jgi:hypothetical protein
MDVNISFGWPKLKPHEKFLISEFGSAASLGSIRFTGCHK